MLHRFRGNVLVGKTVYLAGPLDESAARDVRQLVRCLRCPTPRLGHSPSQPDKRDSEIAINKSGKAAAVCMF